MSLAACLSREWGSTRRDPRVAIYLVGVAAGGMWVLAKTVGDSEGADYADGVMGFRMLALVSMVGLVVLLGADALARERELGTLPLLQLLPRGVLMTALAKGLVLAAIWSAAVLLQLTFALVASLATGLVTFKWLALSHLVLTPLALLAALGPALALSALAPSSRAAHALVTLLMALFLGSHLLGPTGTAADAALAMTPLTAAGEGMALLAWGIPFDLTRPAAGAIAGVLLAAGAVAALARRGAGTGAS